MDFMTNAARLSLCLQVGWPDSFSVPSSSALSAALGTRRSFSPPLSKYQTIGCESSRRSRSLQPKAAVEQLNQGGWSGGGGGGCGGGGGSKKQKHWHCSALVAGVNLRDLSCSKDVLKVLQGRAGGRGREGGEGGLG